MPRAPENVRASCYQRMKVIRDLSLAHGLQALTLSEAEVHLDRMKSLMSTADIAHQELVQSCNDEAALELQDEQFRDIEATYNKACSKLTDIIKALTPAPAANPPPSTSKLNVKLPALDIPSFEGDFSDWMSFKDLFKATIDSNAQLKPSQKLQYLKSKLGKEPSRIISNLTITDDHYDEAWRLLEARYDRKREIISAWLDKLLCCKPVHKAESASLQFMLDNSNECLRALRTLGQPVDHWDSILVHLLSKRLDSETRGKWATKVSASSMPSLREFTSFLEVYIQGLRAKEETRSAPAQNRGGNRHVKVHQASTYTCLICKDAHPHYQCPVFLAKSVKDRKSTAREHNLCFNCLKDTHQAKDCKSKSYCRKCHAKHNTLLHDNDQPRPSAPPAEPTATTSAATEVESAHVASNCQVLLQTAIVLIPDIQGTPRPCRALLDSGSQGSFITEECAAQLQLPRQPSSVRISGIGANQGGASKGLLQAILHSASKPPRSVPMELNILARLTRHLPSVACQRNRWEHIQGLTLADPAYHTPSKIDVLIGADYYNEVILDGRKAGPPGAPAAQQTIFGWVLSGPTPALESHTVQVFHATDEWEILRKFWEVEEPPKANLLTKEERECEEHFSATYTRDASGRFTVSIPFTDAIHKLGKSRESAVRRLIQVEKRLARNPHLNQPYKEFMEEYEKLGHMEKVPPEELLRTDRPTYYIPHHCVTNEDSSTTKVRVVFDASAKTTTGISLNNAIKVGPTVQPDLYTHLLRFRCPAIAIKADIEKMFRMFRLDRTQVDTHRILWRASPSEPITDFRLLTVTYGTAYATHLATRCLKQLALDNKDTYPAASKALEENTYVDDLISGAEDVPAATQLYSDLATVTKSAQLNLRKWSSNSKAFLESIPEELRETDPHSFETGESTKALGVMWNPAEDNFFFRHVQFDEPSSLTKRKLLSSIARVFDPLGLISPVTLQGKLMLQDLWKDKHGWDEQVPEHIRDLYQEYQAGFQFAPDLRFPRRITDDHATRHELHGFSDASEKAYGAVVYFRMISGEEVRVALATSKTRVAPLRQVPLPRLELMAALLLAELTSEVLRILQSQSEVYLWSDSTIALAWIRGEPHRWKTFVANRVAQIQELTPVQSWRHVPGLQNPADLCSRGCPISDLISSSLWLRGPEWLSTVGIPQSAQPSNLIPPEVELEARPATMAVHVTVEVIDWMKNFSSLTKLTRVQALIRRTCTNLFNPYLRRTGPVTCLELQDSLHQLVGFSQEEFYSEEIAALRRGHQVSSRSKLKGLFPYLDRNGVLRVSSRLKHAHIPEERKNLPILPPKSHLAFLVYEEAHRRTLHGGLQVTWSTITQRFWVHAGRSEVRKFIFDCVVCRRYRAEAAQQLMGSLPEARVTVSRPFSHAGVDYAGPFSLKNPIGRAPKIYKGYFCIFVCLATRAIHLEAVSSLSTEAFLDALRRFTSRRGIVSHIYSDHGTNFIGAERELGKLLEEWKKREDLPDHLSKVGIQWEWAPPSAPHHNGMAEAGVKSVKHHLRRIMGPHPMTYEAFATLLCQVESILNSRPIHPMSSDPEDLSALTPGHFLIGEPLNQLPSADLQDIPTNRLSIYQRQQQRLQQFWRRWSMDFLTTLHNRNKWYTEKENLAVGDLVLIIEDTAPGTWKMARVLEVHKGRDNLCRVVTVKTAATTLKRPITKLVPLLKAA